MGRFERNSAIARDIRDRRLLSSTIVVDAHKRLLPELLGFSVSGASSSGFRDAAGSFLSAFTASEEELEPLFRGVLERRSPKGFKNFLENGLFVHWLTAAGAGRGEQAERIFKLSNRLALWIEDHAQRLLREGGRNLREAESIAVGFAQSFINQRLASWKESLEPGAESQLADRLFEGLGAKFEEMLKVSSLRAIALWKGRYAGARIFGCDQGVRPGFALGNGICWATVNRLYREVVAHPTWGPRRLHWSFFLSACLDGQIAAFPEGWVLTAKDRVSQARQDALIAWPHVFRQLLSRGLVASKHPEEATQGSSAPMEQRSFSIKGADRGLGGKRRGVQFATATKRALRRTDHEGSDQTRMVRLCFETGPAHELLLRSDKRSGFHWFFDPNVGLYSFASRESLFLSLSDLIASGYRSLSAFSLTSERAE